jgi:hypothetical protein
MVNSIKTYSAMARLTFFIVNLWYTMVTEEERKTTL